VVTQLVSYYSNILGMFTLFAYEIVATVLKSQFKKLLFN
ncbi:MAG: hypothetical protein ACI8RD_002137, partial [Bacillariaceae sp.]|jgi:hypothetical protein